MTKSLHFDLRNQRLNNRKIDPARRSRKTIRGAASGSKPQRFFTNNPSRRSAGKSSQRRIAATHRRNHLQPRRLRCPHWSVSALDPNESFRSQSNRGASRPVFNNRHGGMDCFVSGCYRPSQQRLRLSAICFHKVWTGLRAFAQCVATSVDKNSSAGRSRSSDERIVKLRPEAYGQAARNDQQSSLPLVSKLPSTYLQKCVPFFRARFGPRLENLGDIPRFFDDFKIHARLCRRRYRHDLYSEVLHLPRAFLAYRSAEKSNPHRLGRHRVRRHGDVRSLASRKALRACRAIDFADRQARHAQPAIHGRVSAHANDRRIGHKPLLPPPIYAKLPCPSSK